MAPSNFLTLTMVLWVLILFLVSPVITKSHLPKIDNNLLELALNLEYLEAEFFLYGSIGKGLDHIQPNLTGGGPPPIGVRRAKLSPLIRNIIAQFGYQEVGHIRAIKRRISRGGFPRPLLNLGVGSFAGIINAAFGRALYPPFDPYANDINFLISSYNIPYVALTAYVGASPKLRSHISKKLVAGLLAVESGQDAVIRSLLYERALVKVIPYGISVAEFTNKISELRNKLGHGGLKDRGLIAPPGAGAGAGGVGTWPKGNLLVGNADSLAYPRTPKEVLRVVYATGKEQIPGGFYPHGGNGTIAQIYLRKKY